MRKLFSIGLAIFSLFSMFCLSACQGMDDVVPESYGEWDNNYVYRGNGRSKTTGEDYEQLVDGLEIDGRAHTVLACVDCEIKADDMYMILACQEEGEAAPATPYMREVWVRDLDLTYCLVVYNIQNKTQKLLATDTVIEDGLLKYYYRPTDIEVVLDETIILHGISSDDERFSSTKSVWYALDLEGNILDISIENGEEWQYYDWVSEEYLVAEIYNSTTQNYELYYRKSDLSSPILLCTYYNSHNYSWAYVEENGVQGILFQGYYRVENSNYDNKKLSFIRFYNFANNVKSEISISKHAQFFGNYTYLKIYDYKTVEYYETWVEKKTANVETGNAIYRIVYDESGIRLEEFFDLTEGHSYTVYGVQEEKLLYCESWYEDPRGCDIFGGREARYLEHDFVSGKKTEIEFEEIRGLEDEYSAVYEKKKGIAVGEYIYFLHEEELRGLMTSTGYAYLLKRVNTMTDEVEVMQLWHSDKTYENNEIVLKYCEALWFVCGSDYEREFDFYEFTVRHY